MNARQTGTTRVAIVETTCDGRAAWLLRTRQTAMLVSIGIVSLATPFVEPKYFARWFDWPGMLVTIPMPQAWLLSIGQCSTYSGKP